VKLRALLLLAAVVGTWAWFGFNALAATWSLPPAEAPATPLVIGQSVTYASLDVQAHNRGDSPGAWEIPMDAQHGSACQGPPATHTVQALSDSVFICNGHVMTSAYGNGYGQATVSIPASIRRRYVRPTSSRCSLARSSSSAWPQLQLRHKRGRWTRLATQNSRLVHACWHLTTWCSSAITPTTQRRTAPACLQRGTGSATHRA
jgi:hypothetical protein